MSTEDYIGPAASVAKSVDRETLHKAIISALPVDWDDYTTLVKVIPAADETGHPWNLWGHPEQVADAVLAALQPWLPPITEKAEPVNDIDATGSCCCNGCIGEGPCDLEIGQPDDPSRWDEDDVWDAGRGGCGFCPSDCQICSDTPHCDCPTHGEDD